MPDPGMQHVARESPPSDGEQSGQRPYVEIDPRLEHLPAHLEVRRVLGEGGSSVVYEAFHTRLKVPVAVKVLSVRNQQARQRMSREAELYALLDDPRIPRVYDVQDLPDGTPFVVMEMVPGKPLEDLIRERGALAPELAIGITKQVLATLASVHARGVLHRDVKPANVILNFTPEGECRVRLVDFGIAKMPAQDEQVVVTQRGSLIGTPQYMAPERLVGDEADSSADTYAAGVMLYEMLAGVPPFEGETVSAIVVSVLREQPKPLLARCPYVSPALEELVERAMAREPAQRFASASQMLEALEAIERERTSQVAVLDTPRASPPRRTRRMGELVLLGLMAATLAVVGLARWYRQTYAEPMHVSVPPLEQAPVVAAPPMTVAPIEWSRTQPKPLPPVARAAPEPREEEPEVIQEAPAPVVEPVVDTPPAAEAAVTPAVPREELLERPIQAPRRTTIDYAKLLPDNPY